jgi:hypothetical protein
MKYRSTSLGIALLAIMVVFTAGCKKMDKERNAVFDPSLQKNLFEAINSSPEFSVFSKYLVKTGYDKVLSTTKAFTVFAPTNEAMILIDASITGNVAKLKQFVANHITEDVLSYSVATANRRVQMANGKYNAIGNMSFENAKVTHPNRYANNGVFHGINMGVNALENCWEFVTENSSSPLKQRMFLKSLFTNVFDPTNAIIVGIDPTTGQPRYQKGTDSVYTNVYWRNVHDLRDEKKQFTVFVLADGGWDAEQAALSKYFALGTSDSTAYATSWNIVKDFAVDTAYDPASLPDTIVSKFGAKLPINKASIAAAIKTSNGYVYVMKTLPVAPAQKFTARIIEGEKYVSSSVDRRSNTYFRDRFNDISKKSYSDVLVLNHGVAMFNLRYDVHEMPAIKYKAYWVAINDFQVATFTQKLGIGSPLATLLPYVSVPSKVKTEVYLGEFTMTKYSPVLSLYLTAANSTANAANPLVCDYIKLVPSL